MNSCHDGRVFTVPQTVYRTQTKDPMFETEPSEQGSESLPPLLLPKCAREGLRKIGSGDAAGGAFLASRSASSDGVYRRGRRSKRVRGLDGVVSDARWWGIHTPAATGVDVGFFRVREYESTRGTLHWRRHGASEMGSEGTKCCRFPGHRRRCCF